MPHPKQETIVLIYKRIKVMRKIYFVSTMLLALLFSAPAQSFGQSNGSNDSNVKALQNDLQVMQEEYNNKKAAFDREKASLSENIRERRLKELQSMESRIKEQEEEIQRYGGNAEPKANLSQNDGSDRNLRKAVQEANLNEYYKGIREMHELNSGPIVVNTERAYDGTMPYWKYKGSGFETFRDEKFVINQQIFKRDYKKLLNENRMNYDYYRQLEKLATMQADTFGLFNDAQNFISLRTGDVIRGYQGSSLSLWESVTYMEYLKALAPVTYDATESMQEFLGDMKTSYRERYIDALIGERVFLLDDLKYDVITDIEEFYGSYGNSSILYFQNHEPMKAWENKCISVKWYEKLQTMVGKKVVKAGDIRFFGYSDMNTTWKENLTDVETYTIEKFELTRGEFLVYLSGGRTGDVFDCCGLLTYPINVDEEWKKKMLKQESRLTGNRYISYDAVLATTPKKPADVKKREADAEAWLARVSKDFSDLRNQKYIGISLEAFLQKWPSAQLINTTSSGGAIIKVYGVEGLMNNYQLIFRNGKCISQTTM